MRLVTWNAQWCCGLDGEVRPERIIETILAMGECDVICLQEIAVNYPRLKGQPQNLLAQLKALLPGWHFAFGAAVHEWTAAGEQQFGNLTITRLPILQEQHFPHPYPTDANVRTMPRMCTVVKVQDPVLGPVRVLNTHLEYFSKRQRMAQARYLRRLHLEATAKTLSPPAPFDDGSPFQSKHHTQHSVLCGDFNFEAHDLEYAALESPASVIECLEGGWSEGVINARWNDAWRLLYPQDPQPSTFRLFDHEFGCTPVACDFVWVSDSLRAHVRSFAVDQQTQASDHQPVRVVIG